MISARAAATKAAAADVACKFAGLFDEAERYYTRAVELSERLGEAESELMATLLHNVGGLAHSRHQYAEGIPPARRGLAMRERLDPPDEYGIAADSAALAALLDEAAHHYDAAIAQLEECHGEHPALGQVLNNRATLHRRLGEDTHARALLKRAHELLERTLGPDHPVTIEVAGNCQRVDATPSPYV